MKDILLMKNQASIENDVNDEYEIQNKRKMNQLVIFSTDFFKKRKQAREKKTQKIKALKIDISSEWR